MMVYIDKLVKDFYRKKVWNILGKNLITALKQIKNKKFKTDTEFILYIDGEIEKSGFRESKQKTMIKNLDYWFSTQYNANREGAIKKIKRQSIINLAFALKLKDKQCNELLLSINHLPLHYGGDAMETIISYSLRNEKSIETAEKLYECYNSLVKTISTSDIQEKNYLYDSPNDFIGGKVNGENKENYYSTRTKYLHDVINHTDLGTNARKPQIAMVLNHSLEKKLDDKIMEYDFSDDDSELLKRLWATSKLFSSRSNKVFSRIRFLINKYEISVNEFGKFYGKVGSDAALITKDQQTVKNIFSFCAKNYRGQEGKKITRTFFIMLCVLVWVKSQKVNETLKDFVNKELQECGYRILSPKYPDDALVYEISKYYIHKNKLTGKCTLIYKDKETDHDIIGVHGRERYDIYHEIVKCYLDKDILKSYFDSEEKKIEYYPNALEDCELILSKQFL